MVLALGLTVATSARPPRPLRLLAFLLGGQALLHVVLTMSGAHGHAASIAGPSTAAMIGAHVAAGLVATVVLLHADDLIDRWQTLLLTALGSRPRGAADDRRSQAGRGRPRIRPLARRAAPSGRAPRSTRGRSRLTAARHRPRRRWCCAVRTPLLRKGPTMSTVRRSTTIITRITTAAALVVGLGVMAAPASAHETPVKGSTCADVRHDRDRPRQGLRLHQQGQLARSPAGARACRSPPPS